MGGRPTNPFKGACSDTALARWLYRNKMSAFAFAAKLRMNPQSVNNWVKGRVLPSLVVAFKIDELTKGEVPASSWLATAVGKWQYENLGSYWESEEAWKIKYGYTSSRRHDQRARELQLVHSERKARITI